MRLLTLAEVLYLHEAILAATRGAPGVRDLGGLESAVAQPLASFGGKDLYASLESMEAFLMLNGCRLEASVDDQEQLMNGLANGSVSRDQLVSWLRSHVAR
jgi:death-on-curing protein